MLSLTFLAGCDDGATPDPEPVLRTLTVTVSGEGAGTVTSTPAGIVCTSADQSCAAEFEEGTAVTLVAEPDGGHEFAG